MKIGIIYNKAFQLISVFQQPMPYAAAAVGYLAMNLTKLGHEITIYSQSSNNVSLYDVRTRNFSIQNQELHLDKSMLEPNFDAFILKDENAEFIINIKNSLPYKPKIYLWTELAADAKENQCLSNPEVVKLLDGIVCVSEWQRMRFIDNLNIDPDKLAVIQYAISPVFENLFIDDKDLTEVKSKTPLFAFTPPADDGLDILLDIFPDVTMNYPNTTLDIFCDLLTPKTNGSNETTFNKANKTKGVSYIGNISRIKLESMLRKHTILPYPSSNPRNSDIYVLEAMAAGLYVLTSDVGCIPEYMQGRGKCVQQEDLLRESLDSFISQLLSICQIQTGSPTAFYEYCYKQAEEMNKLHTWFARAKDWIAYINGERKNSITNQE